ncbi:MAG: hypothetical protein KC619_34545 [Myxococcales bacterium]|nr:hypothetical protein [Myxococcales bacterium]
MTRHRERGFADLVLVGVVTVVLTTMVGIGVGAGIVGSSAGCNDVLTRIDDNEPVTDDELRRCQEALPNQLRIAAAGANFIPTGADDAIVTQPLAAVVDLASQPAATEDAPLPPEIQFARDGFPNMRHCRFASHGLYPEATEGVCYAWSPSDDLDLECNSEGGSAGGGPCPGGSGAASCLTARSSGGFSQWVEYGLSGAGIADFEGDCDGANESYAHPYSPP